MISNYLYVGGVFLFCGALFAQLNAFRRFLILVIIVVPAYLCFQVATGQYLLTAILHAVWGLICIQLGYAVGIIVLHFRLMSTSRKAAHEDSAATFREQNDDRQDVVRFQGRSDGAASQPGPGVGHTRDV